MSSWWVVQPIGYDLDQLVLHMEHLVWYPSLRRNIHDGHPGFWHWSTQSYSWNTMASPGLGAVVAMELSGLGPLWWVATTHMKSMVAAQPPVNWKSWSNREWPLVAICLMSGHAGCTFSGHWWLCLTSLGTTYEVQEHGENNNWKFQKNVSHGWPHGYIDAYGFWSSEEDIYIYMVFLLIPYSGH